MNLIEKRVSHRLFGEGTITRSENGHLYVLFDGELTERMFQFLRAFREGYLVLVDRDEQQELMREIAALEIQREAEAQINAERRQAEVAAAEDAQFNARFGVDYHVEYLRRDQRYTYREVEERFGIAIRYRGRGINVTENAIILISAIRDNGGRFVYNDHWREDGTYVFSGEGQIGDQESIGGQQGYC